MIGTADGGEAPPATAKRLVAAEAAMLVEDGMAVGLGTGSTVDELLPVLAARAPRVVCIATSSQTEDAARRLGLDVRPFEELARLDLAIDGADQVAASGWLRKGSGGAHTREKIAAAAADRFFVIVSYEKLVDRITSPVPLEIHRFGLASTLALLEPCAIRASPPTPDDGVVADYLGDVDDPAALARRFDSVPGVVEHGLFPPELVHEILVGDGERVRRWKPG